MAQLRSATAFSDSGIRQQEFLCHGSQNSGHSAHDRGKISVALTPSQAGQARNADDLGGFEQFCQDVVATQVEGLGPQVLMGHSGGRYQQGGGSGKLPKLISKVCEASDPHISARAALPLTNAVG